MVSKVAEPPPEFPQPGTPEWLRLVVSYGTVGTPQPIPPLGLPGPAEGYRALVAVTRDPVVVVDAALRVTHLNEPFLKLFPGVSEPDFLGHSVLRGLVEWERVRAANLVARFMATGVWDIAELTALRPDGSTFGLEARCEILRHEDQSFAGMFVVLRDLTGRDDSEDPLRTIVAATSAAIGVEFFPSLARALAQIFAVRYAVIGELIEPSRTQVRTIAFWAGDSVVDNFTYDLAGTPCARVAVGNSCYFPAGVKNLFPDDRWLVDVGAEGYLGAPILNGSGRVIGLLELLDTSPIYRSRDVTSILQIFAMRAGAEMERLRIEETLRSSQSRLALAVHGSQDGLLEIELPSERVYTSPRFQEIAGLDGPMVKFDSTLDGLLAFVHPTDRSATRAVFAQAISHGDPLRHSFRWQPPGKATRWLEARLNFYRGPESGTARLAGFISDITTLRRDTILAEETSSLALVGGWELELANGNLHWTPGTYSIHEVTSADYTPTLDSAIAFYRPDSRHAIRAAVDAAISTGRPWDLTLQIETARGVHKWVRVFGKVEYDGTKPVRLIGAIQDVTQRIDLMGQLMESQKMEALGRVVGGVAHDFNNILGIIDGYSDLMEQRLSPGDPILSELNQIKEAVSSGKSITSQMLAFARKQKVENRLIYLDQLLENREPMIRHLLGPRITLEIEHSDSLWPVWGDLTQLDQVILNLTINARDAMNGNGVLKLEVTNIPADEISTPHRVDLTAGDWVRLSTSDTGPGMPPEVMDRAFEPFFTTKGLGKGTGLGLSTCHGVITQAGGHIWAENRIEGGCRIVALLPRAATKPQS